MTDNGKGSALFGLGPNVVLNLWVVRDHDKNSGLEVLESTLGSREIHARGVEIKQRFNEVVPGLSHRGLGVRDFNIGRHTNGEALSGEIEFLEGQTQSILGHGDLLLGRLQRQQRVSNFQRHLIGNVTSPSGIPGGPHCASRKCALPAALRQKWEWRASVVNCQWSPFR